MELARENRVSFLSDAPLEDFSGVTNRIDGFVFLPAGGPGSDGDLENSEFYFEVDLASLDTGLGLRNRHMRENYLDTERFPFASFSGRILSLQEIFTRRGCTDSSCHGSSAQAGLSLTAGSSYGNLVSVTATQSSLFRVTLGNPASSYLVMKVEGSASSGALNN